MKHILQKLNNLDVLTFQHPANNYEDAREGSAFAMVDWANEQALGGATDWILPTRETLFDLHNLFERDDNWYWSSSPCMGYSDVSWIVNLSNGKIDGWFRSAKCNVLLVLVRASQQYDIAKAALAKRFKESK